MGDGKKEGTPPKAANAGTESTQVETKGLNAIVSEARAALGVLSGLQNSLGSQINALEKRDGETKAELARINDDAAQLKKDRSGLVSERATLVKERQAIETRAADLDNIESAVAKKLTLLEKQQATADADLKNLTQEKTTLADDRKSVETLRAEFEADYGSSAEFAQKLEAREKAVTAKESTSDKRASDLAQVTQELDAVRVRVEAQSEKNEKCEEALRLREESVNQFREMLTVMRNGIDDPNGDIGEVVANAAAAERAAIAATHSAELHSELADFSPEDIAAARAEHGDHEASDREIALRLHARRTLGGVGGDDEAGASRWKLPWSK
jgi:chromosome segregation ATPase